MKTLAPIAIAVLLTASLSSAGGAEPKPDADNTGKNERDRQGQTVTPVDQSNAAADIKITADIRRAVIADSGLTATAKNVKIITTAGGKVFLRGPVTSEEEKKRIASIAETVATAPNVTNEIEVKAK